MNESFHISPSSVQGLGSYLEEGSSSIENDLVLINDKSGRWTLIDTRKEDKVPLGGTIIRGKDLIQLMKLAANGDKSLQDKFLGIEVKNLTRDPKFLNLCRLVPGLETPEHIESRHKSGEALKRAIEGAKFIGKGLEKIEQQGLKGRYVGEGQGEHEYWMREVIFGPQNKTSMEVNILANGWKRDKTTHLSLKEWEGEKKKEWEQQGIGGEFLEWIAKQAWQAEEIGAWELENPNETFDEGKFQAWKSTQKDPDLPLPTWLLKKISGTKNDPDFQIWKINLILDRKKEWNKFKEETGADLTFEEHEELDNDYFISGSTESLKRWMMKQLWNKAQTSDDFPQFVQKVKWEQELKTGKTQDTFLDWSDSQDRVLHERHQGSHLPLYFEEWMAQQNDGILVEPAPFVLLDEQDRKIYSTECKNGILERNGFPLKTEFEKTLHSGNGYAIFVISPEQNLYSGSHIGGVFHHSSFLGEGATLAAGEIKTDSQGKLIELSSKSGHYRPTDAQNLYMLQYFQDRGSDLSQVKFTFYDPTGKTEERNAQEYLDNLEHLKSLGEIDLDLFH